MTAALKVESGGETITTRLFGEVVVRPSDVLVFESGIPGFPTARRFALFHAAAPSLAWLQSLDNPNLTFLLVRWEALVEVAEPESDEVWAIVTLPRREQSATANLQAPVLIDRVAGRGEQVVQTDSPWGTAVPFDLDTLVTLPRSPRSA